MDTLKTAIDWTKAEIFSSSFFVVFGMVFVLASVAFRYMGKTDMAKAFVTPSLVAGVLLIIIGVGLVYSNVSRLGGIEQAFTQDMSGFVTAEIARAEKTMHEYQTAVFKVIPLIVIVSALLIIFLDKPMWRAIGITTIAMMAVIMLIDINANARIDDYRQQLLIHK